MFQLLINLVVATLMGLAFTAGGITGITLRDRFFSIDQPPTIQAPIIIDIRPPHPHFVETCPLTLPVQLRYSPLACSEHHGPLALVRSHGFVAIASNHLHRVKPNPWPAPPKPRPVQLQEPTIHQDLPPRNPVKDPLARLARSTWRAFKTITIWSVFGFLVLLVAGLVVRYLEVAATRREEFASIQQQDDRDLEFARLTRENALDAETLQQVAIRLDQRAAECDRYRPEASGLDRCRREAAFFEDTIVHLAGTLALADPNNDLGINIMDNDDDPDRLENILNQAEPHDPHAIACQVAVGYSPS